MTPNLANRFRAAGLHLLISCVVALLSAALVFLVWYPGALAQASGVTDIFLLLLAVDISLGPLITLFVFNLSKPELKRDLAIVGIIQLAALLYGLHTVSVARPAFVVFASDRFDLVFANDLDEKKLSAAKFPEYRSVSLLGPKHAAAALPEDAKERTALIFDSVSGGDDLQHLPKFYRPYAELKDSIIKRAQPLATLKTFNRNRDAEIDALVAKYAQEKQDVGFVPLKGKTQDLTVIISRKTGAIMDIVDLHPWP